MTFHRSWRVSRFEEPFSPEGQDEGVPLANVGPTLSRAIDDYLDELTTRGRHPRTINAYRRILYAFADRFHIDTRVGELEAGDVQPYLLTTPGTANTKAHREVVVRRWLEWCAMTGRLERDPLEGVPRMRRTKRIDRAALEADDDARMLLMEGVRTLSWSRPPGDT